MKFNLKVTQKLILSCQFIGATYVSTNPSYVKVIMFTFCCNCFGEVHNNGSLEAVFCGIDGKYCFFTERCFKQFVNPFYIHKGRLESRSLSVHLNA